jgi:DNA-binding winged helix-turn-helix (wHTH) protein/Flp pilus assembly protein TadD
VRYAFGSYVFDPERWTLSSHGVAMPMMQKTAALLAVLLENAGRLVSKAEILDAVWPDEDVIEANLAQHVFLIRQIFSAHSPGQSFIATHASRGYRFVAPVRTIVDEPDRSPAWREYARGLFYADRRTDASLERALHHFARAVELEPGNAAVHSGIALCHVLRAEYLFAEPAAFELGREAASRAIELDPQRIDAWLARGDVALFRDWDPAAARESYERALWLDPTASRTRMFLGWLYAITGEFERGVRETETGLGADPSSLELQTMLGVLELMRGSFATAAALCDEVLTLDPTHVLARYYRRAAMAYGDAPDAALREFAQEPARPEYEQQAVAIAGYAAARCGESDEALHFLGELTGRRRFRYVSPLNVALILTGLQRHDEAKRELERAAFGADAWAIFLPHHPVLARVPGAKPAIDYVLKMPRATF